MDYFDDEPRTGGGYEHVFDVPLNDPDGIPRRVVVRYRGRFERVAVGLEEERAGVVGSVMRFDDAHGRFHRHVPGWPEPSKRIAEYLDGVPHNFRARYALDQAKARYTVWEAEIFGGKGGEEPQ